MDVTKSVDPGTSAAHGGEDDRGKSYQRVPRYLTVGEYCDGMDRPGRKRTRCDVHKKKSKGAADEFEL